MKKIKILVKIVSLLLVFIILLSAFLFVFSKKLSDNEYKTIESFYTEMRQVEPSIKNDFYVNKLLKVLDRDIILSEFKKDALIYSLTIVGSSIDLYLDGYSFDYVCKYIKRCNLSKLGGFSTFVGLSNADKMIEVTESYFSTVSDNEDRLESFETEIDKLSVPLEEESLEWENTKKTFCIFVISAYFVLLIIWIVIDKAIQKDKKRVKSEKINKEKEDNKAF